MVESALGLKRWVLEKRVKDDGDKVIVRHGDKDKYGWLFSVVRPQGPGTQGPASQEVGSPLSFPLPKRSKPTT